MGAGGAGDSGLGAGGAVVSWTGGGGCVVTGTAGGFVTTGGGTSRLGAVGWTIGEEVTITTVLSAGQLVTSGAQLVIVIFWVE